VNSCIYAFITCMGFFAFKKYSAFRMFVLVFIDAVYINASLMHYKTIVFFSYQIFMCSLCYVYSWSRCEGFSTYPRTYDLIHSNAIFSLYQNK